MIGPMGVEAWDVLGQVDSWVLPRLVLFRLVSELLLLRCCVFVGFLGIRTTVRMASAL